MLYFEVSNYAASSGREGREAFFFFFIYSLVYLLYFEVGNYAASSGREGREAFFFFPFILWCIGCISKSVITRLPVGGRDGKHFFFFPFILWCICCISMSITRRLIVGGEIRVANFNNNAMLLILIVLY